MNSIEQPSDFLTNLAVYSAETMTILPSLKHSFLISALIFSASLFFMTIFDSVILNAFTEMVSPESPAFSRRYVAFFLAKKTDDGLFLPLPATEMS
jgi:hypothetical protein